MLTTSSASLWKGYESSEVWLGGEIKLVDGETRVLSASVATTTVGVVTTDLRNPNMGAVALWYGMVNTVFCVDERGVSN